ncbi:exported hypothetical protein [Agrobacterium fabrum str. J-07]|uniref:hypothetical protein n=1 Tax=Agrobacterium fabrum TaxID=1176649 RepID=UPI0009BAACA7|nr:hypothetical protein [Agrobacterium fabrum]CUX57610.1 exported hypothetical protein [Agrobacterium fabrum str. J-07]
MILRRVFAFSLFLLVFLQQEPSWAQIQSYVDFDANGTVYKLPLTGAWTFSLSRGDQRAHVHLDTGVRGRLQKLADFNGLISEGYRLEEASIWGSDACAAGLFNPELCAYSVFSFHRNVVVEIVSIKIYDDFRRDYEKISGWIRKSLANVYNINLKKTVFPSESPLSGAYFVYTINDNLEINVRIRSDGERSILDKIESIIDDNIIIIGQKLIRGI